MKAENQKNIYTVPSFAKEEAYHFESVTNASLDIYEELSAISEEIEQCRLRNC